MTRINAKWLGSPAAHSVMQALEGGGHTSLFVGGCVRNTLLGAPVSDLDIATDAVPEEVTRLGAAAGLKVVPTGIAHGTVTLVHEGVPVEVTTFRADVETDGRHATVRFTTDLAEDARRRDFTMNALYCDASGEIIDPVGQGLADVRARRLRFVGNPIHRVREDYLRILRFFRFHAWYADPVGGIDADGLAACAEGAEGLEGLSAERVGVEFLKLLDAPDPGPALAAMAQSGVLARILPGADISPVLRLMHIWATPDRLLRLAALGGEDVADRLRLSRADARRRADLLKAVADGEGAKALGWRHGEDDALRMLALRAALTGGDIPQDAAARAASGARAEFPVSAKDLGTDYAGAALGARLRELEGAWIQSDLTASRDELLALPSPT